MSRWSIVKIKDLGRVVTGSTPPTIQPENFGSGYHFIKPPDLFDNSRKVFETNTEISEAGAKTQGNRLLPANTPCVVCIGTIGKMGLTTRPSFTNQQINSIIVDQGRYDPMFVYYLLRMTVPEVKQLNAGSASGRENVNKLTFENIEMRVPILSVQRRIARFLSAYDDLIENSQRRIQILETMARALYREWFVHFRFPGHENVPRGATSLGQIPRGWEVRALREVASVNRAQITARNAPDEVRYIDISSVSPGQIDSVTTYAFSEAPGRARRVVQHGDILWSCVRPNRRSHALVMHPEPDTIASTGFAVLTATRLPFTFLYFATTTDEFVAYLENNATGAAYPAVTATTFEKAALAVPTEPMLRLFAEVTIPIAEQIHVLQCQVEKLRETSDLLLPRLISGELAVSVPPPVLQSRQSSTEAV